MKILRLVPILTLFVIVLGFFYQTVLFYRLPVPSDTLVGLYHPWRDAYAETYPRGVPYRNFLITDPVRQQIPWKKVVIDAWKTGRVPGNNPYAFAGVPIDANIQAQPFYPFNALFLLFPFPIAWTVLVILQPLLASVFFYMYARSLKLRETAAVIGAVSWGFGGFAIAWLTWGTVMHAALWLPVILRSIDTVASETAKKHHAFLWTLLLSVSAILTILGGHMQVAMYALLLSVCYALWRIRTLRDAGRVKSAIRRFAYAAVGTAIVTSVQWLPFIRFVMDSGRVGALASWQKPGWFMPWQNIIQFIAPDFFGNPATLNYWGVWNYGEFVGYVGLIPLVFALSTLAFSGLAGFFWGALLIGVFWMLPHPVSILPYYLKVPIISVLQPTRLMSVVGFSLSLLATIGIDQWLSGKRQVYRAIIGTLIAVAALWIVSIGGPIIIKSPEIQANLHIAARNLILPTILMAAFIAWFIGFRFFGKHKYARPVFLILLLGVVVTDLFRFGWKFTPFTPASYFFPETKVITFLKSVKEPFRVMSLDDRILPPNVGAYYGIETIEGYDPIAPSKYERFLASVELGKDASGMRSGFNRIYTAHNVDSMLLPYFNVRYVLSLADVSRPFLTEVMREGETRVYEYTRALPRVYLAGDIATANDADTITKLFSGGSSRAAVWQGNLGVLNVPLLAEESSQILSYTQNEIRIRAVARSTRMLVILNRYDPRWRVTVDGKESYELWPVNYLFSGVVIPAGTHDIILSYR